MPFTLSHPAAVLPLRWRWPKRVDFAALIIGSMTPDLSYYVYGVRLGGLAHTFVGSFLVCVPSGVLLMLLFFWLRKPVCVLFPEPHRNALLRLCDTRRKFDPAAAALIVLCLLIGAWTHIFWDSFTHRTGWFVTHTSLLKQAALKFGSVTLPMYYVLQQLSSVAGALVLLIAYMCWLKQHRPRQSDSESDRWRYILWLAIAIVSLIVSLPLAGQTASRFDGYLAVRVFLFNTGVYAVTTATCLIIVSGLVARQVLKLRD